MPSAPADDMTCVEFFPGSWPRFAVSWGPGERLVPVCPAKGRVYSVHPPSTAAVHAASRLPSCRFCRHHFIQFCVPDDMTCRQYFESPGASWRTRRSPSRKIHRRPYGGVTPTESRGVEPGPLFRSGLGPRVIPVHHLVSVSDMTGPRGLWVVVWIGDTLQLLPSMRKE